MDILKLKQHKPNIHGRTYGNVTSNTERLKQLQKLLDAYKTRASLVEFRQNVLRTQKRNNYQLEYDRIRGELASSIVPNVTKAFLKERQKQLLKLGAQAINKIPD